MINWNPFKHKQKTAPMNGTSVQFYGAGSNNVKVLDLSGNGSQNGNGVQVIYGQNYGQISQAVNQKIYGEVPMYGQGQNVGFVQAQPNYQNSPYQVQCQPSYQNSYQAANSYQNNQPSFNTKKVQSPSSYPDLNDSNDSNPYSQQPTQQAKKTQNTNSYVKEYAKGNQNKSGNPYY